MVGMLNPTAAEHEVLRSTMRYVRGRLAEIDRQLTQVMLDREEYLSAFAARQEVVKIATQLETAMKKEGIIP